LDSKTLKFTLINYSTFSCQMKFMIFFECTQFMTHWQFMKKSTFDRYCYWQGTLYYYSNLSVCELQGRICSWFCMV